MSACRNKVITEITNLAAISAAVRFPTQGAWPTINTVDCSEAKDRIATLERMIEQRGHRLFAGLFALWNEIYVLPNAWTFPAEPDGVSGFAGLGSTFVIAEQPSRSRWSKDDRGRRLLYSAFVDCDGTDAHLTDIIKSRGSGPEWKQYPPENIRLHIELLAREIALINPKRFVLLGNEAHRLFISHFPQHAVSAKVVPHFGYLRRVPREDLDGWKAAFRERL